MGNEAIKIGGNGYTIPGDSDIMVTNAITFEQDGKVVAQVNATYDTKGLPPELHSLFFQVVNQSCHRIVLPRSDYVPVEYVPPPPKGPPWYRRFYQWLAKLFKRSPKKCKHENWNGYSIECVDCGYPVKEEEP